MNRQIARSRDPFSHEGTGSHQPDPCLTRQPWHRRLFDQPLDVALNAPSTLTVGSGPSLEEPAAPLVTSTTDTSAVLMCRELPETFMPLARNQINNKTPSKGAFSTHRVVHSLCAPCASPVPRSATSRARGSARSRRMDRSPEAEHPWRGQVGRVLQVS